MEASAPAEAPAEASALASADTCTDEAAEDEALSSLSSPQPATMSGGGYRGCGSGGASKDLMHEIPLRVFRSIG